MSTTTKLSEKSMQALEKHIPELARSAVREAYFRALSHNGKVLQALNGELVEVTAEGDRRVIRKIHAPTRVQIGQKRIRKASTQR